MKIVDITKSDTGGQSYKMAKAIRDYTGEMDYSFIRELNYLNYPSDFLYEFRDQAFVNKYFSEADIIHCHNRYRYANGWAAINPDAKWVIHQHGRVPEFEKVQDADKVRKATRIVSTMNLISYVGNDYRYWMPAPMRTSEFDKIKERIRQEGIGNRKIRICHSPTRRDYKNTELLIEIVNRIQEAELVLIENTDYKTCLQIKASCDITFDQVHLCYGNSGLEGMAFGQAVIVGLSDITRKHINDYIGYEPYMYSTLEDLEINIRKLVQDPELVKKYGAVGRKYIEDWHDDRKVALRMLEIYKGL